MDFLSWLIFIFLVFFPFLIFFDSYTKHRRKADAEMIALLKETNRLLTEMTNHDA